MLMVGFIFVLIIKFREVAAPAQLKKSDHH